mmetsp:Transcript_6826/g.16962  ORF Transcript_6826/g.16962 Transcript_6826/m.16962 type:complete len:223 (-) Transcript_6826:302-970(-)
MQICPQLKNLPARIRRAATGIFAPGSTMVGDLPPSSSVMGVKCSAAALATARATTPLPVYRMWSQRNLSSAADSGIPPLITITASGSTYFGNSLANNSSVLGAISEGLRRQQLPAASPAIKPIRDKFTGKFHGAICSTTPFGSLMMQDRPGFWIMGVATASGFIQDSKCWRVWSISVTTAVTSPRKASILGRPRSLMMASHTCSEFSTHILLKPSSCSFRHS